MTTRTEQGKRLQAEWAHSRRAEREAPARMLREIEELEALTSEAAPTHPARIALAALRAYIEAGPSEGWLAANATMPVRVMCNDIAKGRDVATLGQRTEGR